MFRKLIIATFLYSTQAAAQHCPWDCAGMILLQTDISRSRMEKLHPVLVDENKREITDTMYGTGINTADPCKFLYYDDFLKYRIQRISVHHWYQYDTIYHFAAGKYLVKYNFCKYKGKKLYLRFTDPYTRGLTYRYVEIPESDRIYLHEYNQMISDRETEVIRKEVTTYILFIDCEKWGLRKEDCNN